MVKQGTGDDEIVGLFFYYILKDIDSADLETRHLQVHDTTEIDVARDYLASGATRSARARAIDPLPQPTSRQRQPERTPSRVM